MNFILNRSTGELIESISRAYKPQVQTVVRRDLLPVKLTFVVQDANEVLTAQDLPGGVSIRLTFKAADDYEGDIVASCTTWTGPVANVYSGSLELNTTELEALFEDEPKTVTLMGEIFLSGAGLRESSEKFSLVIQNDVYRETDSLPTGAVPVSTATMELGFFRTATVTNGIITAINWRRDYIDTSATPTPTTTTLQWELGPDISNSDMNSAESAYYQEGLEMQIAIAASPGVPVAEEGDAWITVPAPFTGSWTITPALGSEETRNYVIRLVKYGETGRWFDKTVVGAA